MSPEAHPALTCPQPGAPTFSSKTSLRSGPMAKAGPSGLRQSDWTGTWVGGCSLGSRERALALLSTRARLPQSHSLSANMVLFSQGGRALGQARILLSIASPRWPWGSRTPASQAKSSRNLLYEAPGIVQAQGASDVCPSRSHHSSLVPPCPPTPAHPGEGRGEDCSEPPAWQATSSLWNPGGG